MKRKILIATLTVLALLLVGQAVLAALAPGGGRGYGARYCCDYAIIDGFLNYGDCDFGCHSRGLGHCLGYGIVGCYVRYHCSYGDFSIGPFGHWGQGECIVISPTNQKMKELELEVEQLEEKLAPDISDLVYLIY